MLWADPFALSALDTVHSLAMVHGVSLIVHICLLAGSSIHIIQSEVGGNIDVLGTLLHAVLTVRARRDVAVYNIRDALKHLLLVLA